MISRYVLTLSDVRYDLIYISLLLKLSNRLYFLSQFTSVSGLKIYTLYEFENEKVSNLKYVL